MRFWLFTRECDWDEYCGFVVTAETYDEAFELVKSKMASEWSSWYQNSFEVADITGLTTSQIILESFRAG